jgi:hypothetical protein
LRLSAASWRRARRQRRPGWCPPRGDGKERKLAKAGGKKKVHLLGAITHGTGLVIGQDKVAKAGKAGKVTHFKPLLEPLLLGNAVITADAMQATRENARWTVEDKHAHYLVPVLGNQPGRARGADRTEHLLRRQMRPVARRRLGRSSRAIASHQVQPLGHATARLFGDLASKQASR